MKLPSGLQIDGLPQGVLACDLDGYGMYPLGIVFDMASGVEGAAAELLGRLRDLHARRLAVAYETQTHAAHLGMLALGFRRETSEGGRQMLYLYDRDDYNERREWNTPEDWANPENFDRYRW